MTPEKDSAAKTAASSRLYWICQVGGWGAYIVVGLSILGIFTGIGWKNVGLSTSGGLILLSLTHLYRNHAKRKGWDRLSFGALALRIFGGTLVMAVISQLLVSVLMVWVFRLLGEQSYSFSVLGIYVFQTQVILVCWSLIYFSYHAFRNRQYEQVERWKLQAALKDAELNALKAQINPHFIFNCLNNIRALVLENPEKSRDMITRLSDLLRYSIQLSDEPLVALETEIEIVENYLKLESIHYEERLHYRIDIDPELLNWRIPPMSIQLLVENAIKHGISKLPHGGNIEVLAQRMGDVLEISVRNSGQFEQRLNGSSSSETGIGIGLRNSQERLNLLFPSDCQLKIQNLNEQTVEAKFTVPEIR